MIKRFFLTLVLSILPTLAFTQEPTDIDSTALRFVKAGFVNVRNVQTDAYTIYTIENDDYKYPLDGFAVARRIIEQSSPQKPVRLIGTFLDVPELTMDYYPSSKSWAKTTKRIDSSWNLVSKEDKLNTSFGKINLVFYPQVSLMNLIINQVYQSLFQLNPAVEVSLWKGMKFSYQLKIPLYNDGYAERESKIHPEFITLSQRFRDPWNLNIFGRATIGSFSGRRYGAALELLYYFPNERFSLDTQIALLGQYYFEGFVFKYDAIKDFHWNLAVNYYQPELQTQFTIRAQKFLAGDIGVKYEMIKHNRYSSIGLYAEKGLNAKFNVGFRFQIALPPYRRSRGNSLVKINTSGQMGLSYNAGNERVYYKEFRTEASQNIMSKNAFNPYYLDFYFAK